MIRPFRVQGVPYMDGEIFFIHVGHPVQAFSSSIFDEPLYISDGLGRSLKLDFYDQKSICENRKTPTFENPEPTLPINPAMP